MCSGSGRDVSAQNVFVAEGNHQNHAEKHAKEEILSKERTRGNWTLEKLISPQVGRF